MGKSLDLDLLEKQMEAPERKMMVITTEDVSSEESDKNVQRIDLGSENSSYYDGSKLRTVNNTANVSLISPSNGESMAGLSMASLSDGDDCSSDGVNKKLDAESEESDTDVVKL